MYSEDDIIKILKKTGVLKEGHFLLSSGRHTANYLQCALVLQYPDYANLLGEEIARLWSGQEINTVIGPAIGGVIVSYAVAQALGARSIFSERRNGNMELKRSFEVGSNDKVLVVEDVVTTGGSVREVLKLLEERDCEIVGISSIIDRSGGEAGFNYPFKPLLTLNINSYNPDNCPLCKKGIPVTKPGSR